MRYENVNGVVANATMDELMTLRDVVEAKCNQRDGL